MLGRVTRNLEVKSTFQVGPETQSADPHKIDAGIWGSSEQHFHGLVFNNASLSVMSKRSLSWLYNLLEPAPTP
jgi:hypothetical protein